MSLGEDDVRRRTVLVTANFDFDDDPLVPNWVNFYSQRNIRTEKLIYENKFKSRLKRLFTPLAVASYILKILKSEAHVLHANDIFTGLICLFMKFSTRRKLLLHYVEIYSEYFYQGLIGKILETFFGIGEYLLMKYSDIIIIPNKQRVDFLIQKYKIVDSSKFYVVENFPYYHLQACASNPVIDYVEKQKALVYAGLFAEHRNLEMLPELAELLRELNIKIVLLGRSNAYLHDVLLTNDNIVYLGEVQKSQLLYVLSKAHLGIVIYNKKDMNNYLCSPVKIFDYILAQLPFVAVNFPYIQEIRTRSGKIFETYDDESVQDCYTKIKKIHGAYQSYKESYERIDHEQFRFPSQYATIDNIMERLFAPCD